MAEPKTEAQLKFLASLAYVEEAATGVQGWWVGLTDIGHEGKWVWQVLCIYYLRKALSIGGSNMPKWQVSLCFWASSFTPDIHIHNPIHCGPVPMKRTTKVSLLFQCGNLEAIVAL